MTFNLKIGNYNLVKNLGNGTFGKVKLGQHELTGHYVAVKIMNKRKIKQQNVFEKVKREIKVLRQFNHPHIIKHYEFIDTSSDIFMIIEYAAGGELFDYISKKERLSEDEARHFFRQIHSAVWYVHRHKIAHRDLKPENLLLDDDQKNVKLIDFGLSNLMKDANSLKTACGSPNYAAPEVVSGRSYGGKEADVWSMGVILYAMVCGALPFDEESITKLFGLIRESKYIMPQFVSPQCQDLLLRILQPNPVKRITMGEIRNHDWFMGRRKLIKLTRNPSPEGRIFEETTDGIEEEEVPAYLDLAKNLNPPSTKTTGAASVLSVDTIDHEIVDTLFNIGLRTEGLTREDVIKQILERKNTEITGCYELYSHEKLKTQCKIHLKNESESSKVKLKSHSKGFLKGYQSIQKYLQHPQRILKALEGQQQIDRSRRSSVEQEQDLNVKNQSTNNKKASNNQTNDNILLLLLSKKGFASNQIDQHGNQDTDKSAANSKVNSVQKLTHLQRLQRIKDRFKQGKPYSGSHIDSEADLQSLSCSCNQEKIRFQSLLKSGSNQDNVSSAACSSSSCVKLQSQGRQTLQHQSIQSKDLNLQKESQQERFSDLTTAASNSVKLNHAPQSVISRMPFSQGYLFSPIWSFGIKIQAELGETLELIGSQLKYLGLEWQFLRKDKKFKVRTKPTCEEENDDVLDLYSTLSQNLTSLSGPLKFQVTILKSAPTDSSGEYYLVNISLIKGQPLSFLDVASAFLLNIRKNCSQVTPEIYKIDKQVMGYFQQQDSEYLRQQFVLHQARSQFGSGNVLNPRERYSLAKMRKQTFDAVNPGKLQMTSERLQNQAQAVHSKSPNLVFTKNTQGQALNIGSTPAQPGLQVNNFVDPYQAQGLSQQNSSNAYIQQQEQMNYMSTNNIPQSSSSYMMQYQQLQAQQHHHQQQFLLSQGASSMSAQVPYRQVSDLNSLQQADINLVYSSNTNAPLLPPPTHTPQANLQHLLTLQSQPGSYPPMPQQYNKYVNSQNQIHSQQQLLQQQQLQQQQQQYFYYNQLIMQSQSMSQGGIPLSSQQANQFTIYNNLQPLPQAANPLMSEGPLMTSTQQVSRLQHAPQSFVGATTQLGIHPQSPMISSHFSDKSIPCSLGLNFSPLTFGGDYGLGSNQATYDQAASQFQLHSLPVLAQCHSTPVPAHQSHSSKQVSPFSPGESSQRITQLTLELESLALSELNQLVDNSSNSPLRTPKPQLTKHQNPQPEIPLLEETPHTQQKGNNVYYNPRGFFNK